MILRDSPALFQKSPSTGRSLFFWISALALCIALTFGTSKAAHAQTTLYVLNCDYCQLSSDFYLAAESQAQQNVLTGMYVVTSTIVAETAFIKVGGTRAAVCPGAAEPLEPGHPEPDACVGGGVPVIQLTNITATPVDENGNSLAGESEEDLDAAFITNDLEVFTMDRAAPIHFVCPTPTKAGNVEDCPSTWVNNQNFQENVLNSLGMAAQNSPMYNVLTSSGNVSIMNALMAKALASPNFTYTFTVTFPDGSQVEYDIVYNGQGIGAVKVYWTGKTVDKNGNQITQTGVILVAAPGSATKGNSSTGTGVGSGNNHNFIYKLQSYPGLCVFTSSVSLTDEQGLTSNVGNTKKLVECN